MYLLINICASSSGVAIECSMIRFSFAAFLTGLSFSSSHPCKVVNSSISTTSYATGSQVSQNPHYTSVDFDLSQPNQITVSHEIYNTLGSGMDCAPITIAFDLQHSDDATYTEHIVITQNPALTQRPIPSTTCSSHSLQKAARHLPIPNSMWA